VAIDTLARNHLRMVNSKGLECCRRNTMTQFAIVGSLRMRAGFTDGRFR